MTQSTEEIDVIVEEILASMTLAQKAGMLFHTMIVPGPDGSLPQGDAASGRLSAEELVRGRGLRHFNIAGPITDAAAVARFHNAMQRIALDESPQVPITFSSDPRHAFTENIGTAALAGAFSEWPEAMGLAAIGDETVVERFADIARQEYLAAGLRVSLHPQIDLATEPRWARVEATFGEDTELTGRLARAYIRGFQGEQIDSRSVSTMTKHFPGGGPQKDGEDPHFVYGKEQVYPADLFYVHLKPFIEAIEAGTRQIMPSYGQPIATEYPEVAFGFSKPVLTELLRERLGFTGIICTDWAILSDVSLGGNVLPARAWGVEHLDRHARARLALEAGVDQFGGEDEPQLIIDLVERGLVTEERIDASVRRLLAEKVLLGLVDQPLIDEEAAVDVIGSAAFREAGLDAQSASVVVLEVGTQLPARRGLKVYTEGLAAMEAAEFAEVVDSPAEADLILIRQQAPFQVRDRPFEDRFHYGNLEFSDEQVQHIAKLAGFAPVVLDIHLDRPAVLTPLVPLVDGLTGTFGVSDRAWLRTIFGDRATAARLPIGLPRSMADVIASDSDAPSDGARALYPFGAGISIG